VISSLSLKYGRLAMKVSKNVTAIAKYSNYDADGGAMVPAGQAADVERISVEANLVF
jgi:hypothetical protein